MLVFTDLRRTPELSEMAECLGIIDGNPFSSGRMGYLTVKLMPFYGLWLIHRARDVIPGVPMPIILPGF